MWARFFLVGSRTDLRLKMGLLGVVLGVYQVWCRNSHFQWSKPPQFENFSEIEALHKVMVHFFSGWVQRVLGASSMFLRGTFVRVKFFCIKWQFQYPKKTLRTCNLRFFSIFFLQILGAFFFWQGPECILDSKWVYLEYIQGYAKFCAEINIF